MNGDRTPAYDIARWRLRIPLLATHVPMNNCSQAPQTLDTREAAHRYLDSWNSAGMDWDSWMHEVTLAKQAFARLINADADEIAIVSSVSEAVSAIASALDFSGARRTVVLTEAEFPTVGHVWLAQQRRGATMRWVPVHDGAVDPAAYDGAMDDRTCIVSACHGYYLTGATQDLALLSHVTRAHGALLFVDAYQTLGAVPVDVKATEIDFLASGNLKYLMGVPGIAFLYVRRALIERLEPTITGWFGRANPFAFSVKALDWSPTASRFDTGTPPVMNAYIARAGMDVINSIGVEHIRDWHTILGQHLLDGGRARGLRVLGRDTMRDKTANTAFIVDDAHRIEVAMHARGVVAAARGPVIRLAPHFYTTLDDCDVALDVLAATVKP